MRNNRIRYMRVSLTGSCNFNCFYCRPHGADMPVKPDTNNIDNFKAAITLMHDMGVQKIRFTGGEPTLSKNLIRLIKFVRELDHSIKIAMTSNGFMLSDTAKKLADAGLGGVNISLDTLDPEKFRRITGRDGLNRVIDGIEAAVKFIPEVKLNCVLMKGINDQEAEGMVSFAGQIGIPIRFIEFMPTRITRTQDDRYVSGEQIRKSLPYSFKLITTDPASAARYYFSPSIDIPVGFINPVSHPFCQSCDRVRLAADGMLFGCLFSNHSINLFDLLSQGLNSAREKIIYLVESKKYLGCMAARQHPEKLPSFFQMGG